MSSATPAITELHGVLAGTSFDWGTFTLHSAETQIESTWDGQQLTSQVAASTLRMAAEGGAPRGWHADVARAALQTNLRMTGDKLHGPMHLEASRLVGRAGLTGIQGDIAADFSLGSSDPLLPNHRFWGCGSTPQRGAPSAARRDSRLVGGSRDSRSATSTPARTSM